MTYTDTQIGNASQAYNRMLQLRSVESYEPQYIGWNAAEQRSEYHNNIVREILGGNVELANHWKLFFLNEEVKTDKKLAESKSKKAANKAASSDILVEIKASKRIIEFGKWLNTRGNIYRNEHFSKKYTQESVHAFLTK